MSFGKSGTREMSELERIKRHVDGHGVGCVIVKDHVVISIAWASMALDGHERRMETTKRATTLLEACEILGCRCDLNVEQTH